MLPRSDLTIYAGKHEQYCGLTITPEPPEEPDHRLDQSNGLQPYEDHPGLFADERYSYENRSTWYIDDQDDEYHSEESEDELSIHTIDSNDPQWSNQHDI